MPEYTVPLATVGEEAAPTVEKAWIYRWGQRCWGSSPWTSRVQGWCQCSSAASNELPEYRGGANFVLAASNDLPEYRVVSMALEAAVHEVPEYKRDTNLVLAAADNKLSLGQDVTYQAPAAKQDELPNTGSKETSSLISLGLAGVLYPCLHLARREKNNK